VPGRPDAGPTVASPYDLGVERENNRERIIAEPVRQRTEGARRSSGFHGALGLEVEAVAPDPFTTEMPNTLPSRRMTNCTSALNICFWRGSNRRAIWVMMLCR
jgi:hypothetical protein